MQMTHLSLWGGEDPSWQTHGLRQKTPWGTPFLGEVKLLIGSV